MVLDLRSNPSGPIAISCFIHLCFASCPWTCIWAAAMLSHHNQANSKIQDSDPTRERCAPLSLSLCAAGPSLTLTTSLATSCWTLCLAHLDSPAQSRHNFADAGLQPKLLLHQLGNCCGIGQLFVPVASSHVYCSRSCQRDLTPSWW
jgi:hypothetical protein